jgi:5-methylcytosine-specific restriction endonuclease McrA
MGAPLAQKFGPQLTVKSIELPIAERLQQGGIDVNFDEIRVLGDRTLEYKGHRVLLYIRDVADFSSREKQDMPKFHFIFCSTLKSMSQSSRFGRYVVANRTDGEFQVNLIGQQDEPQFVRLNVCQNCLSEIRWKGFHSAQPRETKRLAVADFSLPEFFDKYPRDLVAVKPNHTSETAPLNVYPANWAEISDRARRNAFYKCGSCSVQIKRPDSKFLHVHHKNGQKNDCHPDNLEVLCIECHADEPMHGHMKALPEYREFLEQYGKG